MSGEFRTSEIRGLLCKESHPVLIGNEEDENLEGNEKLEVEDDGYKFPEPRITIHSACESISRRSSIANAWEDCEDPNLEKIRCTICRRSKWTEEELVLPAKRDVIVHENRSINCTIRRATRHDIKKIYSLPDEEANSLFSGCNIYRLIECAYIQFIIEEVPGNIVAFIAVNDYPNPTYLPKIDWECWMASKYKLSQVNTQNSVFLHFFVWNYLYKDFNFMEKLAEAIFLEEPFIEYFLFVLPPFKKLSYPYDQIFSNYEEKLTVSQEISSTKFSGECEERYAYLTKDLVVACREEFGPKIKLLDSNTVLNPKMCEIIEEAAIRKKWVQKVFSTSDSGKKIITAVCENQEGMDAGLMVVKEKMDLSSLEKQYDTLPFYGFRSSTNKDTWFRVLSSEPGLQCFQNWCSEQSAKLLVDPITQRPIRAEETQKFRFPPDSQKLSVFSDSESDSEEYEEMLNRSTEAYLDMFKTVGKNVKYEKNAIFCPNAHPVKKPSKLEFFGKSLAMEIEFYDPPANQNNMLIVLYLRKLFLEIPKIYILIKIKDDAGLNPLLHYFHMVKKHEQKNLSKDVLYTVHRAAILGTLSVRKMFLADIESLMAMCRHHPYKNFIQEDLLNIHLQRNLTGWVKNSTSSSAAFFTLEYKCFVFTVSDVLIGFTVVRQHHNIDYYKSNYDLEFFMKTSCHTVLSHGAVRHFFISPIFRMYTRFFLRAVMKSCGWTTLLAPSFSCYPEAKGCSVVQELEQWVQVRPRVLPEMSPLLDRRRFLPRLGRQYRGLNLMTYGLSAQHKLFFGCHLVVVGSGDVARSFLEYLLLSRYTAKYGFRNITVIANDGMQSVFPGKHMKAMNMMVPWNGRHDQFYKDKCNIDFWVKIIFTNFIGIDRERSLVELENGDKLFFDYLFLFCGTQFPPIRCGAAEEREEDSKITNEVKIPEMLNVFTVNNHYEANDALYKLENLPDPIKYSDGGQIIVFGNCVEAFSCVAGLLESGIGGYKISLLLTAEGNRRSVSYIHSHEIMDSVRATLKKHRVNVYEESTFLKWMKINVKGHPYVDIFHFKSGPLTVILKVTAIFCYHRKVVNKDTYLACKKSGLWYYNKLTIQTNFLTSDKKIYAGGSMTSYPKAYRTVAYDHEFYNSFEIGVEVAKTFLERLVSPNNSDHEEKEETLLTKMIVFDHPLVISAEFPGGWQYARITAPGNQVISMTDRSLDYKLLKTGDALDENGPGLIQILLCKNGVIKEIVCFRRKKIPVKDLINLFAKHESLVNDLLCRFKGGLIRDLYEFLSEPWALFIYDDRFSTFYHHLHSIYTKNIKWLSNLEGSFTDFVNYALNLEKWKEISYEDKEFLEDLFCYHPELKRSIEKHVIRFLEHNEDLLIMLRWREYRGKYLSDFSRSRLLGDVREERGVLPQPQPVRHIVPEVRQRRELDGKPLPSRAETFYLGADVRATKRERRSLAWRELNRTTAKGQCLPMNEGYGTGPREVDEDTDLEDIPSNLNDMQYEKCIELKLNQFQMNM